MSVPDERDPAEGPAGFAESEGRTDGWTVAAVIAGSWALLVVVLVVAAVTGHLGPV